MTITQGISGTVKEISGNQMPGPGVKRPEPKGLRTTLYVYELTSLQQVDRDGEAPLYKAIHTKLVDSVQTNDGGQFSLSLPVGKYSLFTRVGGQYFANLFDANNNIFPVTVEKDKVTPVDFLVNINATY